MFIGGICYLDSWLRDNCSAHLGGVRGFGGMILVALVDLGGDFCEFADFERWFW